MVFLSHDRSISLTLANSCMDLNQTTDKSHIIFVTTISILEENEHDDIQGEGSEKAFVDHFR